MTLEETILEIIKSNLSAHADISISTELNHDNGVSSFDKLMIINGIEDHFSITFNEAEMIEIRTIGDLVDMVRAQIAKKG